MLSTTPSHQSKAVLGQLGAEEGLRARAFLNFGQYIVADTTPLATNSQNPPSTPSSSTQKYIIDVELLQ